LFGQAQRCITAQTATVHNRFVASLADAIFVAHAEANSNTERFCHDVLAWRKPLYTPKQDGRLDDDWQNDEHEYHPEPP